MAKKLKIKISKNGKVELYTEGIKGKKCLAYLPLLEQLADISIQKTEKTKEYYEDDALFEEEQNFNTN